MELYHPIAGGCWIDRRIVKNHFKGVGVCALAVNKSIAPSYDEYPFFFHVMIPDSGVPDTQIIPEWRYHSIRSQKARYGEIIETYHIGRDKGSPSVGAYGQLVEILSVIPEIEG